jgi:hypothetical protein
MEPVGGSYRERAERRSGEQRLQPWGTGEPLNPRGKRGAGSGYNPGENGEQRLQP